MKEVKLSEKQQAAIGSLASQRNELEGRLASVNDNLKTIIEIIAEFNEVDKYENVEINNDVLIFK
jgi:hypothetical protein